MSLAAIQQPVLDELAQVNLLVSERLSSRVELIEHLSTHIIGGGGKRLRPLLLLLAAKAFGMTDMTPACFAATAFEYFHTATLLHDDVVDESSLRRGKETSNEIWGSKASILVGDYLYTQSLRLFADIGDMPALALFIESAHRIIRGEIKQLINSHQTAPSLDDYFSVIHDKTGLLFAAAGKIGVMLAGGDAVNSERLYHFGLHLGNAFQLADDALDFCSDSQTLGKNIGDDISDGKATLPLIHAMNHATADEVAVIKNSLVNGSIESLDIIQQAISSTDAIEYTYSVAKKQVSLALNAIAPLSPSIYKSAMIELAEFAILRKH